MSGAGFFLNLFLFFVMSASSAPRLCPASLYILTEFPTVSIRCSVVFLLVALTPASLDLCLPGYIVLALERPLWQEVGSSAPASDSRRRGVLFVIKKIKN